MKSLLKGCLLSVGLILAACSTAVAPTIPDLSTSTLSNRYRSPQLISRIQPGAVLMATAVCVELDPWQEIAKITVRSFQDSLVVWRKAIEEGKCGQLGGYLVTVVEKQLEWVDSDGDAFEVWSFELGGQVLYGIFDPLGS